MDFRIIGDKEVFGIEYSPVSKGESMGVVCLWIGGVPVGTLDDATYLPSFQFALEGLVNPEVVLSGESAIVEGDDSQICLEDTFDDFLIHRFRVRDNLVVKFKLLPKPYFRHPKLELGKTYVHFIPLNFAEKIVAEFIREISKCS